MDKVWKQKWIAALRSGEYQQGTGQLSYTQTGEEEFTEYCCLGVLCSLVEEDYFDGTQLFLPNSIAAEVGIDHAYDGPTVTNAQRILSGMNDGVYDETIGESRRYSFAEIADWIEANL